VGNGGVLGAVFPAAEADERARPTKLAKAR